MPRIPSLSLLALLAACHDSLAPGTKTSGATILSGADVSDTVDAVVTQLLVVEARENSNLLPGVEVAFSGQYVGGGSPLDPSGFLRVCDAVRTSCGPGNLSTSAVTDGRGRASVRVQFGALAGQGSVIAYVPGLPSSDTAYYTVRPGAPTRVSAFAAGVSVDVGATVTLNRAMADRFGNTTADPAVLRAGAGSAFKVDSVSGVITGLAMGTQWIVASAGRTFDSTLVRVLPTGRLVSMAMNGSGLSFIDINGGNERIVTTGGDLFWAYMPRASAVANHTMSVLGIDNFPSGSSMRLQMMDSLGNPMRTIQPPASFSHVAVTRLLADGTVMVAARLAGPDRFNGHAVYRFDAAGGMTKVASIGDLAFSSRGADFSSDGRRVAYIASTADANRLRVLDLQTGVGTILAPEAREPAMSPDGAKVAYFAAPDPSTNTLYGDLSVVNIDGTGRRVIRAGQFGSGVAWSPDGTMVLARGAFDAALYVVRASDAAAVVLKFPAARAFITSKVDWWR